MSNNLSDYKEVYVNMYASEFVALAGVTKSQLELTRKQKQIVGRKYVGKTHGQISLEKQENVYEDVKFGKIPLKNYEISPSNYSRASYISRRDGAYTNSSVQPITALELHAAAHRMRDAIELDELASLTLPADNIIAADGTNLTYEKIVAAKAILTRKNTMTLNEPIFLIMGASQQHSLELDERFTNKNFTGQTIMTNGGSIASLNPWSINIVVLSEFDEGGLPYNSGTKVRTCYMFSRASLMAVFTNYGWLKMTESEKNDGYNLLMFIDYGIKAIPGLLKNIVSIDCDESTT